MLIHPWDAAADETEWREWLARHDFGQIAANGLPGEPPLVQPAHFRSEAEPGPYGRVLTHLSRPNPLWRALEANPRVLLSFVDDYVYVPGTWTAPEGPPSTGPRPRTTPPCSCTASPAWWTTRRRRPSC